MITFKEYCELKEAEIAAAREGGEAETVRHLQALRGFADFFVQLIAQSLSGETPIGNLKEAELVAIFEKAHKHLAPIKLLEDKDNITSLPPGYYLRLICTPDSLGNGYVRHLYGIEITSERDILVHENIPEKQLERHRDTAFIETLKKLNNEGKVTYRTARTQGGGIELHASLVRMYIEMKMLGSLESPMQSGDTRCYPSRPGVETQGQSTSPVTPDGLMLFPASAAAVAAAAATIQHKPATPIIDVNANASPPPQQPLTTSQPTTTVNNSYINDPLGNIQPSTTSQPTVTVKKTYRYVPLGKIQTLTNISTWFKLSDTEATKKSQSDEWLDKYNKQLTTVPGAGQPYLRALLMKLAIPREGGFKMATFGETNSIKELKERFPKQRSSLDVLIKDLYADYTLHLKDSTVKDMDAVIDATKENPGCLNPLGNRKPTKKTRLLEEYRNNYIAALTSGDDACISKSLDEFKAEVNSLVATTSVAYRCFEQKFKPDASDQSSQSTSTYNSDF
jgi:hypothetical protein